MDHQNAGPLNLLVSIYSTVFAWITLHDVQMVMTLLATLVSIVSGVMAGYYYFKKARQK